MNKKLISALLFTITLISIFTYLVFSIFFTNYHNDWRNSAYKVLSITDGDTIKVQGRFSEFTVRYIGIDTPETEKNDQKAECFGDEAADYNSYLLKTREVYLETDLEDKDRYGRDLRYVYIKNESGELEMINFTLVKDGYAKKMKISPNTKYSDQIEDLESEAKRERRGLWGEC